MKHSNTAPMSAWSPSRPRSPWISGPSPSWNIFLSTASESLSRHRRHAQLLFWVLIIQQTHYFYNVYISRYLNCPARQVVLSSRRLNVIKIKMHNALKTLKRQFSWFNKFALLWGEAQLCLPYVCPKVTYSDPKVTYSDPTVTHNDHTHLPLPPPTSPEPHLAIS